MLGMTDKNRKWWILAAMGAVLGVILLDETVVGVALPTIQSELGMSEVAAHWVVNIYMLVLAGFAPSGERVREFYRFRTVTSGDRWTTRGSYDGESAQPLVAIR